MSNKKTYLYRMLIGYNDEKEHDFFMFARNAGVAVEYCKELYRDKHYNSYTAIKVGVSHILRPTEIIDGDTLEKLRNSIAMGAEKYAERDDVVPEGVFINSNYGSDAIDDLLGSDSESVQPA